MDFDEYYNKYETWLSTPRILKHTLREVWSTAQRQITNQLDPDKYGYLTGDVPIEDDGINN